MINDAKKTVNLEMISVWPNSVDTKYKLYELTKREMDRLLAILNRVEKINFTFSPKHHDVYNSSKLIVCVNPKTKEIEGHIANVEGESIYRYDNGSRSRMEEGFFGKYIENYHVAVESPEKQFEKFVSDNGVNYYIRIPYVTNNYLDCSRDNNTYTHGFKELNNNLVLFKFNLNTNQLYCSEDYEVIIGFTCQNEICTNAEIGAFYHDAETIVYEGSNMYEVVQQSMLRENNFIEEVRAEFPDNFKRLKEREYQNFSQEIKKEILQCVKFALGLSFVLKKDKDFCLSSRLEKDVHKLIEKLDDACNQKDEIAELVCKIFAKSLKAEKEDVHAFVDEIYDEMFFDIEKKCNPAFIDDFLKEENILKRNTKNTFRNLEDISDEAYWKTRKKEKSGFDI